MFLSFISLVGDYATKDSIMTNGLTLILNRNFIRISKEMLLGQSISESILFYKHNRYIGNFNRPDLIRLSNEMLLGQSISENIPFFEHKLKPGLFFYSSISFIANPFLIISKFLTTKY